MKPPGQDDNVNADQPILISPVEVLEHALYRIEPNGSVRLYCNVDGVWHWWRPYETVTISDAPPDVFANTLLWVARIICGTVSNIHLLPASRENELRLLALHLTRYRNERDFLYHAASLTTVTTGGEILHPTLPKESPWEWVPEIEYLQKQG